MHSQSFSAYLNIALNKRSREGWGRMERAGSEGGREEEQGANGWLKE